jgi:hypothetical protein
MVIIYNYDMQILNQQHTNASLLLVITVAMGMRQYGTKLIDLCVVFRASI